MLDIINPSVETARGNDSEPDDFNILVVDVPGILKGKERLKRETVTWVDAQLARGGWCVHDDGDFVKSSRPGQSERHKRNSTRYRIARDALVCAYPADNSNSYVPPAVSAPAPKTR